jgi:hypothetical protein
MDYSTEETLTWVTGEAPITVRNPLPQASALEGVESDTQEHDIMSCCCFKRGAVECDVQVDKKAYYPGEFVEFEALVRPTKDSLVRKVRVELVSCVQLSKSSLLDDTPLYPESPEVIIEGHEVSGMLEPIKLRFQIPQDAASTSMGVITRRMHFIRVSLDTPSTFYTEFFVAVNVLPSKEADYTSIPGSLAERIAQVAPGPCTQLAREDWILPTKVKVNGQPLGRQVAMHVPEY